MRSATAPLLSAALLSVAYLTKPTKKSFTRTLIHWIRQQHGILSQAIIQGAIAMDQLANQAVNCIDFKLFSYIQLKPQPNQRDANTLLADLFDEDEYFGAVGVFGHWFGVRIRANRGRDGSSSQNLPQIFLMGSAIG